MGIGAASGAVAGLVGWAVPAGFAALGMKAATAGGAAFIGGITGALAAGAGRITANLLTPCAKWYTGVRSAMFWGALGGALLGWAGWHVKQWWIGKTSVKSITTPTDLYAFGGKTTGPRSPRIGTDLFPDTAGMIGAERPPFPNGASTYANPNQAPLSGHYHLLPKGTQLPSGLGVIADGIDVNPRSVHPATHHTLYPIRQMPIEQFIKLFESLPWLYGGKK